MKFRIEQVALYPLDPDRAIGLLQEMGMSEWVNDIVVARGKVRLSGEQRATSGERIKENCENVAHLSFNYEALKDAKELEVLHYTAGHHWMSESRVSHLGMHVTEDELDQWKQFFKDRAIGIAQEVNTLAHTNPVIAGKRWYHYCIFDTYDILGVDIKFIVRKDAP